MNLQRSKRIAGQLVSALFIASSSALIALPAAADTFTPLSDPPTVDIVAAPLTMQPNYPSSLLAYSVRATVGTQGTVANLDSVTMCFYRFGGDNSCANASTDPQNEFKMTWTQSTGLFSVTGINNYEDSNSTAVGLSTDLSLDITFDFVISNAMDAGYDWEVKVMAIDDDLQNSDQVIDPMYDSTDVESSISVMYWGEVTTAREGLTFGSVAAGQGNNVDNASLGDFVANATSYIYLTATNFQDAGDVNTLWVDSLGAPQLGYVALACEFGATGYTGTTPTYLATVPQLFASGVLIGGTGETADSSLIHSCRLEYGGGAVVSEVEYDNTVTVSISDL